MISLGPGTVAASGTLKNYNTIEEFKNADKHALFNQAADEVSHPGNRWRATSPIPPPSCMLTYKTNHRSGTPSSPPAPPPSSHTSSSSPSPTSRNINITTGLPSLRSLRNRRGRSRGSGWVLGRGLMIRRCVCGPLLKTWSTDLLVCEQMSSIHARLSGTTPTKAFFLVKPSKTKGEVEIAPVEEWASFFEGVASEDVRPALLSVFFFPRSCSCSSVSITYSLFLSVLNIHSCRANVPLLFILFTTSYNFLYHLLISHLLPLSNS